MNIIKSKYVKGYMKTCDGRFIENRVKIPKDLINETIKKIKLKNNLTWDNLARILGVSTQTLRVDWLIKGNTIPESVFNKIKNFDKGICCDSVKNRITFLSPFWGQKKGGVINKEKRENNIHTPDLTSAKFAEFYGIMLGDGCVYSNINGLCIAGDSKLDKIYHERYIKNLIDSLFGIKPKIYYSNQSNSIRSSLYSRKITRFIIKQGFPKGKKKLGKLEIPTFILNNKESIKACIRGLNDTDGTICSHPHSHIMIQISITVPSLLNSCKIAFKELDFKGGFYNKGINIYGKEKVAEYFKIFGSSNPKHLIKYKLFQKTGKIPSKQEIESFLREKEINKKMDP